MSLLSQLSGTLINVAAVLLGTLLGLTLGGRLPERTQRTLLQTLGLVTLYIGLGMAGALNTVQAGPVPGVIVALVSLALGAVIGEALGLEDRLAGLGEQMKRRFQRGGRGGGRFTEGFVAASLLFCIGPLTVVGGIQNGLTGDSSSYVLKATLDGIAALALAGVYGVGVGFSALTVLVIQGGISLAAGGLAARLLGGTDPAQLATNPYVLALTGVGGLTVLGISVNLLLAGLGWEDRRVRVGSLLPALLLAPLVLWLGERL